MRLVVLKYAMLSQRTVSAYNSPTDVSILTVKNKSRKTMTSDCDDISTLLQSHSQIESFPIRRLVIDSNLGFSRCHCFSGFVFLLYFTKLSAGTGFVAILPLDSTELITYITMNKRTQLSYCNCVNGPR